MLCAFLTVQAVILFAANDAIPIKEAQLVGTWESTCKDCYDIHGTGWIAYRLNHTCTMKEFSETGPSYAHGNWQLAGRTLVTRFGGDLVTRETILSIGANRFVARASDGTVFTYTRVRTEQ